MNQNPDGAQNLWTDRLTLLTQFKATFAKCFTIKNIYRKKKRKLPQKYENRLTLKTQIKGIHTKHAKLNSNCKAY